MGHHINTGIALGVSFLLVILSAVLLTVSTTRLAGIQGYDTNDKLKSAYSKGLVSYILAYSAAAILFVLTMLYFFHGSLGGPSEWPHLIMFFIIAILLVISAIYAFWSISELDQANATDNKGSKGYVWGALAAMLIGLIILIVSGSWRASYKKFAEEPARTQITTHTTLLGNQPVGSTELIQTGKAVPDYQAPLAPGLEV